MTEIPIEIEIETDDADETDYCQATSYRTGEPWNPCGNQLPCPHHSRPSLFEPTKRRPVT
jgi:hypothetical protein